MDRAHITQGEEDKGIQDYDGENLKESGHMEEAGIYGKGKVHPRTGHEGPQMEQRYSFTLSLTSALNEGGWSMPRPGSFIPPPERDLYPLYRRLGGHQGRSGWVQKISPPLEFDPWAVQPEASHYTN